ncbi:MAG: permease [Acidobacteria bacterium]|nr:permease [Acidobacteriota bacterium]
MTQIGDIIQSIIRETVLLYNEMAIYLLLGFAAGGIIHAFLPQDRVKASIGRRGFMSALKASLLGVPLPLCSCSVIPTSLALHRSGATTGATVSFLISTPQTGLDSIAVTYSLLGPVYALFRPVVAFVTGTVGGLLTDFRNGKTPQNRETDTARTPPMSLGGKFARAYEYGFHHLIRDLARWIVLGILLGGAITALVPDHFLELSGGSFIFSYVGALLFSIPLYVCATGSTPVAAALILKGLSPGAAFVLLMAGPATNAAGITMLWKTIGRRATLVYLGVIVAGSVGGGIVFDLFLRSTFPHDPAGWQEGGSPFTFTLKLVGSGVLLFYLLRAQWSLWRQRRR